jgi:hypothetical protein
MLAPDFGILDANPAFLTATQTDLLAISHCPVFDVFPDNPGDPEATGVRNARASLNTVLKHKQAHMMPRNVMTSERAMVLGKSAPGKRRAFRCSMIQVRWSSSSSTLKT